MFHGASGVGGLQQLNVKRREYSEMTEDYRGS